MKKGMKLGRAGKEKQEAGKTNTGFWDKAIRMRNNLKRNSNFDRKIQLGLYAATCTWLWAITGPRHDDVKDNKPPGDHLRLSD